MTRSGRISGHRVPERSRLRGFGGRDAKISLNTVVSVDIARRVVVQRWPLQGCDAPTGMAIDEIHRRLFIGCNATAVLAVFDLDEHRVVATVPIGKSPDSVAFDPALSRIYTTGKSGVLVVVRQEDPNKYKVIDTIHLHYGAHTLTVDPVAGP